MRREARIGFAIVGCLAAVLTYAAVKRMWLLAQVTSNPRPAPVLPAEAAEIPTAIAADRDAPASPVITMPESPTSRAVYQQPVAVSPRVPFPSRFAIPLNNSEATEQAEQTAAAAATETLAPKELPTVTPNEESVAAKSPDKPLTAAAPPQAELAELAAAPPLKQEISRFSAAEPEAKAETVVSDKPKPADVAKSRVSLPAATAEPTAPGQAEKPQPAPEETATATAPVAKEPPTNETPPEASLRFVGEKAPAAETPTKLLEPAAVAKVEPAAPPLAKSVDAAESVESSADGETKKKREAAVAANRAWRASEVKQPSPEKRLARPRPQAGLNRAFASTASNRGSSSYVPAKNASTTKTDEAASPLPQRLPPAIEAADASEQAVTREADPAWVRQMISSGSFIPGQRIVPTHAAQATPAPQGDSAAAPRTYQVRPGDDLATIARQTLGDASRWGELFRLNRDLIGDYPDQMKPGMLLRLPERR
ncbi:MAG: hypothetical protein ACIALR_02885 [Blastopirellula sp. JB062]